MNAKSYSKGELAAAYAPDVAQKTALNRLNAWIHHNPDLVEALNTTHYRERQKLLTARQVELIFKYLGEP